MAVETPEERGRIFVRGACRQMGLVTVLLLLTMSCVRVYAEVIRSHRSLSARVARVEVKVEKTVSLLQELPPLREEVGELVDARAEFAPSMLPADADALLDERMRRVCRDARVEYDGLTALSMRMRGPLDSQPYKVRFRGRRHQVPVVMEGVLNDDLITSVTSLDLEVVNFVDDRVTGAIIVEFPRLREPPAADGEIVRPFLVSGPDAVTDGPMATVVGPRRRQLEETTRSLRSLYPDLLDYESHTLARNHYLLERREIRRLTDGRGAVEADVARILPRVDRALSRSALGRAGFHAEPGGAVELMTWD